MVSSLVGKSNVMDAISFVLGISAQHLRSSQLKDLIYRQETDVPFSKKAHVAAFYEDDNGSELVFKRTYVPISRKSCIP